MMRQIVLLSSVALLLSVARNARGDGNPSAQTANVQGILRTTAGNLQSTAVGLAVNLYSSQTATTPYYTQSFTTVPVENGFFSVELSGTSLSFSAADTWVGIQVSGDASEMPRQHMTAVPYAFVASSANSADSLSSACSGCVVDSMIASLGVTKLSGVVAVANGGTGNSTGAVGGDLAGTLASATVAGIQNQPVSATAPAEGNTLRFTSGKWTPSPNTILCKATWAQASTSPFAHTFVASECGGTLPDSSYYGVPVSWGGCDGIITITTYQATDGPSYPGVTGFIGDAGSSCPNPSNYSFSALYIKM